MDEKWYRKKETEGLIMTAQDQSLQKRWVKHYILQFLWVFVPFKEGLSLLIKRLSLVSYKQQFDSLPLIEKSSQTAKWLQFDKWLLTDMDKMPLACLAVLGNTP